MPMGQAWMQWAVAEGGTKALGRVLGKFIGIVGQSLSGALAATAATGAVQCLGGLIGARLRHERIVPTPAQLLGGIAFGLIATAMVTLAVFSFTFPGADVGVTTFIVTMSIIPGALIDWAFFRHPLVGRQWLGIVVFLFAGYAMLDFPVLGMLAVLPPWVWLTVVISVLAAVNEGITQAVRAMDPLVNNIWIGLTMAVASLLALVFLGGGGTLTRLPASFWFASVLAGVLGLAGVAAKLLAYKGGGSIALKKLIMQGTYLTLATALGIVVYSEPVATGKVFGVLGFFVAFTLMDQGTWGFVARRFRRAAATGYDT